MQYECHNDYYNEYNPQKRRILLDSLTPEAWYEADPDQMRALFECRYSKKRKANADLTDTFIGSILTSRTIAYNSSGLTKRRQDDNILIKTREDLMLFRSLFSEYPIDMTGYHIFLDAIDKVEDDLVKAYHPRSRQAANYHYGPCAYKSPGLRIVRGFYTNLLCLAFFHDCLHCGSLH
ncbi:MAG: hypothetical protein LUC41_06020 [Clostridiales bacterium]|nr:hypothetical protein [Clostridiales bacterium]